MPELSFAGDSCRSSNHQMVWPGSPQLSYISCSRGSNCASRPIFPGSLMQVFERTCISSVALSRPSDHFGPILGQTIYHCDAM